MKCFVCRECEDNYDYTICHAFVEYDENVKPPNGCLYTDYNPLWRELK